MMASVTHGSQARQNSVDWCNMIKLALIFIGVNNCYWITIYNVTQLDGNKFVNGIILGLAELASGIISGFVISKTSPSVAFQICATSAVGFNALNQFVMPVGSVLGYVTLALAIIGVGGVYTCIYVLIYIVVPKHQVGGAMVLIVTIGTSASLFAPIIVLYKSPIPFIALASMMAIASLMTSLLPAECPEMVREQEEHLMEGWHGFGSENTSSFHVGDRKAPKRVEFNRSLMNLTREKTHKREMENSFAIYATRDGFVPAMTKGTNSSLYGVNQMKTTVLGGGPAERHSFSIARRYQPNLNHSDNNYTKVN